MEIEGSRCLSIKSNIYSRPQINLNTLLIDLFWYKSGKLFLAILNHDFFFKFLRAK